MLMIFYSDSPVLLAVLRKTVAHSVSGFLLKFTDIGPWYCPSCIAIEVCAKCDSRTAASVIKP